MDSDKPEPWLLTVGDVAALLQCSTQHVRKLVREEIIPDNCVRRLGRLLRFHPGLLKEWLASGQYRKYGRRPKPFYYPQYSSRNQ